MGTEEMPLGNLWFSAYRKKVMCLHVSILHS